MEAGLASCSPNPGPRVEELADLTVVVVEVHGVKVHVHGVLVDVVPEHGSHVVPSNYGLSGY